MKHVVALFGEAEKGPFLVPHVLREMPQLIDSFGNPPPDSEGLFFAIQALLFQRELIFFRVEQEGFDFTHYSKGLQLLENREQVRTLHALCLPGVGDERILSASRKLCSIHNAIVITTQKDLYDYLTSS